MARIEPKLPAHMFKTFAIAQPIASHFRPATCAEVQCRAHVNGWITRVPVSSGQAAYIRGASGRRFTEAREGEEAVFTFEAGQTCFAADGHRISLEREPVFLVRGGDHRGNPSGERRFHDRAEHWQEDFAEHQARVEKDRG